MTPTMPHNNANVRPLVINLVSGPGSGKSTLAAMIFAELKALGTPYSIELAVEFAKELVWEGRHDALRNQLYVMGEQFQRVERVAGKCDLVVTDSPVVLSAIYAPEKFPAALTELALWCTRQYPSLNVFVDRPVEYESIGRIETRAQAEEIDRKVLTFMHDNGLTPVHHVRSSHADAQRIARLAVDWLNRNGGPVDRLPAAG